MKSEMKKETLQLILQTHKDHKKLLSTIKCQDILGGPVVMNPPANAGNMDLIPGPGRFHMLKSN